MKQYSVALSDGLTMADERVSETAISALRDAVEADGLSYSGYETSEQGGRVVVIAKVLKKQKVVS